MATPACLVTSTPAFDPPKPTAPFLIAATAVPDPRMVIVVESAELIKKQSVDFSAHILSEDDGQKVSFQLYIDYGFPDNPDGLPFRGEITNITPLVPGTITDATRPAVEARWFPNSADPGLGCHNVTLIASHEFDQRSGCPVCKNDSSQITWQVYRCDVARGYPCKTDFTECQKWNKSCPDTTDPAAMNQCGAMP